SVAAFFIVILFRHPIATALTISASLAQIGEFSFILADLGVKLDLLPKEAHSLILGGAILSILMNPVLFVAIDWLKPRLEKRMGGMVSKPVAARAAAPAAEAPPDAV